MYIIATEWSVVGRYARSMPQKENERKENIFYLKYLIAKASVSKCVNIHIYFYIPSYAIRFHFHC